MRQSKKIETDMRNRKGNVQQIQQRLKTVRDCYEQIYIKSSRNIQPIETDFKVIEK